VSAVEFNETGEYIATGDRGGRVVIFQRCQETDRSKKKDAKPEYKFFTEFQSHELEFDYLKSIEIEEKINKIKWAGHFSDSHTLLTTNDKTIKLWKVREKKIKHVMSRNLSNGSITSQSSPPPPIRSVKIPLLQTRESVTVAAPRKIYANAHTYHINSISINSDRETFLSADDLRINLWRFSVPDLSFNIVDIKPANMEELSEVITCAEFHPQHCNLFMHSSSKGTIKLADMRSGALCDQPARVFEEPEDLATRSYFSDIISSISDIKFSNDGRYILSRDYINIKLWDINMEHKPVKTIAIHDYLRTKLCDMYEHDWIFDRFECAMSGDGNQIVAGSYHNYFHIYDVEGKGDACIEASKYKRKNSVTQKMKFRGKKDAKKDEINPDAVEFTKKALHVSWHPKEALVAIGAASNLFLYYA